MKVYQAINAIQKELAKVGISKNRENKQQGTGYKFRGIDDVYNTLSPLLGEHGLCILPRVLSREVVERESRSGAQLFYVTVDVEFDFVAAEDGSKHTVRTVGEAMDSGDKATNKAMSAAYKYAAFQAFAIPTEGDNDADGQTHEVKSASQLADEAYKAACAKLQPTIDTIKAALTEGNLSTAAEAWFELSDEEKMSLWKAPRNGGCFTTREREIMKSKEFRQAHYGEEAA